MTLSNIQIQKLIENGSKNEFSLKLIPSAKIAVASRKETWLLTEIDPENTNVAYGLCKPVDHFSFLSHIDLNSQYETDNTFAANFSAETYQAAEYWYGELIYDKETLQSFGVEVIKPAQLSLF